MSRLQQYRADLSRASDRSETSFAGSVDGDYTTLTGITLAGGKRVRGVKIVWQRMQHLKQPVRWSDGSTAPLDVSHSEGSVPVKRIDVHLAQNVRLTDIEGLYGLFMHNKETETTEVTLMSDRMAGKKVVAGIAKKWDMDVVKYASIYLQHTKGSNIIMWSHAQTLDKVFPIISQTEHPEDPLLEPLDDDEGEGAPPITLHYSTEGNASVDQTHTAVELKLSSAEMHHHVLQQICTHINVVAEFSSSNMGERFTEGALLFLDRAHKTLLKYPGIENVEWTFESNTKRHGVTVKGSAKFEDDMYAFSERSEQGRWDDLGCTVEICTQEKESSKPMLLITHVHHHVFPKRDL